MRGDIHVVFDNAAIKLYAGHSPKVRAGMDRLAGQVIVAMKAAVPVSPVQPVYASPVPVGRSSGPAYRGRGLARPSGPDVPRTRYGGDLPLPASGTLRNSVRGFRLPDGSIIVGPTAPYGPFVNDGTPPHLIASTGPWPLRNRASGQVFGRQVHHPGTRGAHFIEKAAGTLRGVVIHLG